MTVRSPHTRRVTAHRRSLGSATSQSALSWLNFLIALMQTAFGDQGGGTTSELIDEVATMIVAGLIRPEMKVEIEATAFRAPPDR